MFYSTSGYSVRTTADSEVMFTPKSRDESGSKALKLKHVFEIFRSLINLTCSVLPSRAE